MGKTFSNSYDDLLKDMEANNIKFSDYDLELAKKNPDAGRSLYTQKVAYGQAATDEERQKANDEAERIRQQYGGYKAGTDGTGYTLSQTYAPPASEYVSQYQDKIDRWTDKVTNYNPYSSANGDKIDKLLEQVTNPEKYQGSHQGQIDSLNQQLQNRDPYQSQHQGQIDSLTGQLQNRDPYQSQYQSQIDNLNQQLQNRDPYQSQYQGDIDSLLHQVMNRGEFSYNPASDPSYQAYSEKYRNAGNQAMQNALGSAAAMNGGQLSSYALTSAQQAQNNYAAQMSDMLPQLQQLAYRMYQDDGDTLRQNLINLLSQDDRDYNRYQDDGETLRQNLISLLNQDELAYGRYQDEGNALRQNLNDLITRDQLDYGRYQDEGNTLRQDLASLLSQDDREYSRYQDGLAQNQNALQNLLAMDDRDYGRYMDQLGIDQSILSALMQQDNNAYNRHQNSQADELNRWQMNYGVDRDMLADQRYEADKKLEQERYDQNLAWQQEDRDYNRAWEQDDREYDRALNKAKTLASVGDFSGYKELGYTDEEIAKLSAPYHQPSRKVDSTPKVKEPEKKPEEQPAEGNGVSYNSIWSRARTMYDSGKTDQEITDFLDQFSEHQLTDTGLSKIIKSLNLGGVRG